MAATCMRCGDAFEYVQRSSRERVYCSKRCKDSTYQPRAVRVTTACLFCGVEFSYVRGPGRPPLICSDDCSSRRKADVDAKYYLGNADAIRLRVVEWRRENREHHRAMARAWAMANKEHVRKRQAAYAKKNAERVREIKRRYALRNPEVGRIKQQRRRARLQAATIVPFTAGQLKQRMDMFPGCWICGDPDAWHMDHVKPLVAGGPHILANLRKICVPCNSSKGGRWPLLR